MSVDKVDWERLSDLKAAWQQACDTGPSSEATAAYQRYSREVTIAFPALQAEVGEMREALRPFAALAEVWRRAAQAEKSGCPYRYSSSADMRASDSEADSAGDEAVAESIERDWIFAAEAALKATPGGTDT